MPSYSGYTTEELLNMMADSNYAAIVVELKYRLITDEEDENKGGIRPTHQPINP